jgi:hypothetical protein
MCLLDAGAAILARYLSRMATIYSIAAVVTAGAAMSTL